MQADVPGRNGLSRPAARWESSTISEIQTWDEMVPGLEFSVMKQQRRLIREARGKWPTKRSLSLANILMHPGYRESMLNAHSIPEKIFACTVYAMQLRGEEVPRLQAKEVGHINCSWILRSCFARAWGTFDSCNMNGSTRSRQTVCGLLITDLPNSWPAFAREQGIYSVTAQLFQRLEEEVGHQEWAIL